MRRAALCTLVLFSTAAMADWDLLADTLTGKAYVDRQTITNRGRYTKMWVMHDFLTEHKTATFHTFKSVKLLELYDCAERTEATQQEVFYDSPMGEGNVTETASYDLASVSHSDVVPGSLGEHFLNFVCASTKPSPRSR